MTTSSFRIVRYAAIMLALGLTMSLLAQDSSAQSCGYGGYGGYGYGGQGIRVNYNYGQSYYNTGVNRNLHNGIYHPQSSIRQPYNTYRSSYRPAHTWHDTSHWDYHPGRYVPHGNHLDYIPGHRTWHRSGHVDHNHR